MTQITISGAPILAAAAFSDDMPQAVALVALVLLFWPVVLLLGALVVRVCIGYRSRSVPARFTDGLICSGLVGLLWLLDSTRSSAYFLTITDAFFLRVGVSFASGLGFATLAHLFLDHFNGRNHRAERGRPANYSERP